VKRSRIFLLLGLLLVIVLVTSGCFQIRMFKLNKDSVAAGEQVTMRVEAYPVDMSGTDTNPGYFFLLIGYDNIDWQGSSQIDADGNWGGPYNKGNNQALVNLLLTAGNCDANGIDPADMEGSYDDWRVVVSLDEFGPEGATAAELGLRNRTQLYFNGPVDAQDGDRGDIVVFSGIWLDEWIPATPGVPDPGEVFCNSMVATSVPYTD
jgi:hypothetical protein